ncbi:unnamed protein product, partial [Heterosigma akashiwo]
MLFHSFFKTLVGKEIAVELKNDVALTGTLRSVDQYLNIRLSEVQVVDSERYPQLLAIKNCFIRGSRGAVRAAAGGGGGHRAAAGRGPQADPVRQVMTPARQPSPGRPRDAG